MSYILEISDIESNKNKVNSISNTSTENEYPSAKAVYDALQNTKGTTKEYVDTEIAERIVVKFITWEEDD